MDLNHKTAPIIYPNELMLKLEFKTGGEISLEAVETYSGHYRIKRDKILVEPHIDIPYTSSEGVSTPTNKALSLKQRFLNALLMEDYGKMEFKNDTLKIVNSSNTMLFVKL